jgi:hypothetical protein
MLAGVIFTVALFMCPVGGVIDRVEGASAVVLGATGVRVVARRSLTAIQRAAAHEGDRIENGPLGMCLALPPAPDELGRIRDRLRSLGVRP